MDEKVSGYWTRKYGEVERHGFAAFGLAAIFLLQTMWGGFSISCLLAAVAFAGAGGFVVFLRKPKRDRDDLKSVEIDLMGLSGIKFSGSDIRFKWTDLSFVKFNESKKGRSSIEFAGKSIRARLSQDVFENYGELHDTLNRRIPRKRVRIEERELDEPEKHISKVEKAPTIIKDATNAAPKQLFHYVIGAAYVILLLVIFFGWGMLEGCLIAGGLWLLMLLAWIYAPKLLSSKSLGQIRLTREGAIGKTFDGKSVELEWNEVLNVTIHFPPSTGGWKRHAGRISINGEDAKLAFGLQFPKFSLLASHLNEICINRGIRIYTHGSPVVAHKPLEEAEKRRLEKFYKQSEEYGKSED